MASSLRMHSLSSLRHMCSTRSMTITSQIVSISSSKQRSSSIYSPSISSRFFHSSCPRYGWSIFSGLKKTREALRSSIGGLLSGTSIVNEALFTALEDALYTADVGSKTTSKLMTKLRQLHKDGKLQYANEVRDQLKTDIKSILEGSSSSSPASSVSAPITSWDSTNKPLVTLIIGVNGVGKTTTIGKLSHLLKSQGKSLIIAAGDTFRAAAVEQLQAWGKRADVPVVARLPAFANQIVDPAAVVFQAIQRGVTENVDLVLCDTAGRLQNKVHMMEELDKIKKVCGKARAGAPDRVLLVLDATTGQNGISQAKAFKERAGGPGIQVGVVLTKLDGSAKGGVVVAIAAELGLPVSYVGVGEGIEDLKPFDASEFVNGLLGDNSIDKE